MTTELTMLAWTLVLALVQVFLPVGGKTMVWGSKWNAGPRDETPATPLHPVTGRLDRAQINLYETLPVFIAAVLIAHVAGVDNTYTAFGAQLYFWARLAYVPLYAFGVPYVRSLAFVVSFIGLVMILLPIFGVV
jgi:uncharacterized MAPEG superfamily protein